MANTTISPNMNLPVPTVGIDPGPDYATNINASLNIVDSHNHSSGQGVTINPNGLNINADLPFNGNNVTSARSVNYQAQTTPLTGSAPDLGCTYVSGVDLYYNDENGVQIRMTQGGSIIGTAGSISGLPAGTASVSYATGTYTFLEATSTPGGINAGPITLARSAAGSKTVTLNTSASQSSNYSLTLPVSLPTGINYLILDSSGTIGFNQSGYTGAGAVALASSPVFTGTVTVGTGGITYTSGTQTDYAEGTWTPTMANINGTSVLTSLVGRYQRVGHIVNCNVVAAVTYSSSGSISYSFSLPIAPANNFSDQNQAQGLGNLRGLSTRGFAITSAKTIEFIYDNSGGGLISGSTVTASHTFSYIVNT